MNLYSKVKEKLLQDEEIRKFYNEMKPEFVVREQNIEAAQSKKH